MAAAEAHRRHGNTVRNSFCDMCFRFRIQFLLLRSVMASMRGEAKCEFQILHLSRYVPARMLNV